MHSAIVVVKIPEDQATWLPFLATVKDASAEGALRLGENVWLVNFQAHPVALATLVKGAVAHGLTYGILQLDAEPQWLPAGIDPKTILDRSEA
jgi:hypothetical protein